MMLGYLLTRAATKLLVLENHAPPNRRTRVRKVQIQARW
jgi:hypothetical protein